jgi:VanZ family protein
MRQAAGVRTPQGVPLAGMLALAYTAVIAYASLQPFRDWRFPPPEILRFLVAPWPHYVTLEDLTINFAAYVPLGFLLALALQRRISAPGAALAAAALAALLSLTMESIQMFLPSRIASNVDLLMNGGGALFGAMAAPLFRPSRFPGSRLAAVREEFLPPGTLTDIGLAVVFLWLVTHLHPTAQPFGTGDLRGTFDLPGYFAHTPQRLFFAEAVVVLFNLLGLGLLMASLMRRASLVLPAIAAAVATGLTVKTIGAVMLFDASAPLVWLTPGAALGLAGGALLLYLFARLPRIAALPVALACLAAATVAINLAPGNPYQTLPPGLVPGSATYLLRFSNIVRALSELWPFLAMGYLAAAMVGLIGNRRRNSL